MIQLVSIFLLIGCSGKPSAENLNGQDRAAGPNTGIDYGACVRNVLALDPASDARREIAKGNSRPFLQEVTDPLVEVYAPGLKQCELELDPSRPDERKLAGYNDPGDLNGYAAGRCSLAIARYRVAYNRALFRQSVDHLGKRCGAAVRIDPAYPSYDDDLKPEIEALRARP